jgi:peroxiredoxin
VRLAAGAVELPPTTENARIVLTGRTPLPDVAFPNADGVPVRLRDLGRQPLLLNLWSSSCAACMAELKSLSAASDRWRKHNLRILALNVDRIGAEAAEDMTRPPFHAGYATEDFIRGLEAVQRSVVDRSRPLPLPSSFLVDRRGLVTVIYKGAVKPDELASDLALLEAGPGQVRDAAVPFAGRWRTGPLPPDPIQVALMLYQGGHLELAQAYVRQCGKVYAKGASATDPWLAPAGKPRRYCITRPR